MLDKASATWSSPGNEAELCRCVVEGLSAVARRWPDVLSNAVDPGWVPTKMGGPGAPDDFEQGYLTQTWLAVSDDPAATLSGGYWRHRRQQTPAREASDHDFQDRLSARLSELTGISLF